VTREYWTNHKHQKGLLDSNQHIAALIRRSFEQSEMRLEDYVPYRLWKQSLKRKTAHEGRQPEERR
jgi:hypothetical protein